MLSKSCWRERAGETCRKQKISVFAHLHTRTHKYSTSTNTYAHLRTLTHIYTHLRTTEQNWPELSTITPQLHHNYSGPKRYKIFYKIFHTPPPPLLLLSPYLLVDDRNRSGKLDRSSVAESEVTEEKVDVFGSPLRAVRRMSAMRLDTL